VLVLADSRNTRRKRLEEEEAVRRAGPVVVARFFGSCEQLSCAL
jgi:hypothetical protein